MGSAVSMTIGLLLTVVVFLLLPEHSERIAPEFPPLLRAVVLFAALAAAAVASFYGEVRERSWRPAAHAGLVVLLSLIAWLYWPE